ncbi:hypothetical protein DV515_00012101, partial [Chloebia gouldiae]
WKYCLVVLWFCILKYFWKCKISHSGESTFLLCSETVTLRCLSDGKIPCYTWLMQVQILYSHILKSVFFSSFRKCPILSFWSWSTAMVGTWQITYKVI